MAEDYVHDIQRQTRAETFFRTNRTGIADAAAIKPEDIEKFNSIVFGPDVEQTVSGEQDVPAHEMLSPDATQADKISSTLKLLKYLPDL
jgi:hypothetical protein